MDDDMCGCSQLHLLVFSQEQHTEVKGSFENKYTCMHMYTEVKGSFEKQVDMYA